MIRVIETEVLTFLFRLAHGKYISKVFPIYVCSTGALCFNTILSAITGHNGAIYVFSLVDTRNFFLLDRLN